MNDEKKFTPDKSVKELSENELENVTGGREYVKPDGTKVTLEKGNQFTTPLHPGKTCTVVLEMMEGLIYSVDGEYGTFSQPIDSLNPTKS